MQRIPVQIIWIWSVSKPIKPWKESKTFENIRLISGPSHKVFHKHENHHFVWTGLKKLPSRSKAKSRISKLRNVILIQTKLCGPNRVLNVYPGLTMPEISVRSKIAFQSKQIKRSAFINSRIDLSGHVGLMRRARDEGQQEGGVILSLFIDSASLVPPSHCWHDHRTYLTAL